METSHGRGESSEDLFSDVQIANSRQTRAGSSYYSARFWDTLSKVRLSRRALRELDGRQEQGKIRVETTHATSLLSRTHRFLRSDARRLRQIASNGGPDLSILRGYSYVQTVEMSQSSSQSRSRSRGSSSRNTTNGKSSSTSPYSAEFEQKMIDNGVFPEGHEDADGNSNEPVNLSEIREVLQRARESLSPSRFPDSTFKHFRRGNRRAQPESKLMTTVLPIIAGERDAEHYSSAEVIFNRLRKFDPDVSSAKPDVYYGARPALIDTRVRQKLGEYIVPSGQATLPAAPNYFFEGKSASGKPDIAQLQAMYACACGARGILHLQNYGNEVMGFDEKAYTMSATYSDGQLKLYATHPRQSTQAGHEEYHMTQVGAYAMTHSVEDLRLGAAAYRNARDWTKEQRDRLIVNANIR